MSEQSVLYKLVEDVGGLKADVENISEAQGNQWRKINEVKDLLTQCNSKLDTVMGLDGRVERVEAAVDDYRWRKAKLIGIVTGIGISTGSMSAWIMKMLGKN